MTAHTPENTPPEHGTDPLADNNPASDAPIDALAVAEQKAAEHYEALLRAKAETENMRRRASEDVAKAAKFAGEKLASAMVPVKDSLEAALAAEATDIATLRAGVELTLKQLEQAFGGAGIEQVDPLGEKFDPHKHQAISQVDAPGEPNHVVQVLQKGYLIHDRVLRPALVIVSKAAG
ncbi:MAG: nucleotide exchange factor GrpE [Gammaproteobacteria bacterium]|jgi:molecular chaperone GrpE|nr:nucleotide exchange factor GrpE [Gammaproteobacteria bacterium]MBU0770250.1 nucleotide exchange factor GrpE [Gammaproteobacteria bacterium]MBU0857319.1 nucleotide exchange factor GrpE [Gammaproteobacteria bacterium]MBU1846284.1 nucleotide exchange factor GrpE [Gammaproteobacteria bacterium]